MRRTLRWLAASLVALLLLALAAGGWLLHTESGMRWALASGIGAAVGQIEYSGARGTLAGGFEIDAPRVQLPQLRINATHLQRPKHTRDEQGKKGLGDDPRYAPLTTNPRSKLQDCARARHGKG